MAQGSGNSRRIIELTASADSDRFGIYEYTAQQWGPIQAQKYNEFLDEIIGILVEIPELAPLIPDRNQVRVFLARLKDSRSGHRIFFRETPRGILILRILHTSMNWQDHLK